MPDPLDALRAPITPADPDPTFATRLRERLVRALDVPRGVSVSTSTIAEPTQLGAAIPYLTVSNGRDAIDWYARVFGAELTEEPYWMPDGKIGHAELRIGDGAIYLADEFPPSMVAPSPEVSSTGLAIAVSDVDSTVATAVAAGGRLHGEIYENYGYRAGTVYDPFGHRWMIRTPLAAGQVYRHGDIAYVSLWLPDADRAADFFGSVLGWSFAPAVDPRRRRVEGATPPIGIQGGMSRSTLYCCYAVDDVEVAIDRIHAAGGTAQQPTREPYGLAAMCVDDQGVDFAVVELEPGTSRPARGGLAYYTFEVPDSAKARAFYGSVLGWNFTSGRVADGWAVDEVFPMTGLSGGHEQPTGVPLWRVADIGAAVQRVRQAGGTATDPASQPYGVTSDCTDDQGTHFNLGQL
ncbi:MAG TPA: VOC family protein [Mycobacteriales bacterium]|nr:VOC family protein [Mycobacteriales bacterium]